MLNDLVYEMLSDEAAVLDGYDDCVIGIGSISPHTHSVLIYDVGKIISSLMGEGDMDFEDAEEFYSYHIAGSYMGDGTPILMTDKIVDGDIETPTL